MDIGDIGKEGNKDTGQREAIIKKQLTLRAIIWELVPDCLPWKSYIEHIRAGKLVEEMRGYQIQSLQMIRREREKPEEWYRQMQARLEAAGISEAEAVLVTDDPEMAAFLYGMHREHAGRNGAQELFGAKGLAVVYYEMPGSRRDASADMIVQGFEEVGVQFLDRVQKRRNGLPWNILYTPRLCVREISMDDIDGLFELYRGKGITDHTEPLYERKMEEAYTRNYITHMYYYYGYGMWVLTDRESGRLIGRAGIEQREKEGDLLMELGYVVGVPYQGRGYATEACRAILEYAAEELQMEEMHCFIRPQNLPSIRVARKLGFALYGEEEGFQGSVLHYLKKL